WQGDLTGVVAQQRGTLHQEEVGLPGCAVLLGGLRLLVLLLLGGLRRRREQGEHGRLPVPGGGGRVVGVRPGQLVEGAVAGSLHECEQVFANMVRHTLSLRGTAAWIVCRAEHRPAVTDRRRGCRRQRAPTCSGCRTSPGPSATCRRWPGCPCTSPLGRPMGCSGPTAPARRPRSR